MNTVLIVDDEPLLREELQEAFELEDYDVTTASCVAEAVDAVAEQPFAAVITDLKMPQQGGLELIRHLNHTNFTGTVVVVSGHGAESSREEAMSLGAAACFAKPLDPDQLIEFLRENR